MSGVGADGKAKYRDVYGKRQEEVEARLETAGRLYQYGKRETVGRVFRGGPPAATLEQALRILEMEFELRGFTQGTKQKYIGAVRKFVATLGMENDIQSLTVKDAKNFILNQRKVCGMAASTCNGYTEGIRQLFAYVLEKPVDARQFPHFRKKKYLPDVLTRQEVERLIAAIEHPKYRMIAILMYSSGLRVSEAVNLRITDIRRDKMLIFVAQGKGAKDRYAVLSQRCLRELETYWRLRRPKEYFFPSPRPHLHHISTRAVEDAVRRAARETGLPQHVTPHTLRHCFATHLVEANTGLFQTMQALGHASLKSTQIYVHLAGLPGVKSPYDA